MHKDQYTDAPSQEQVRVKTMLNMDLPLYFQTPVIT